MKLIVGLGNPEQRYKNTRHNLGFAVLDELSRKLDLNRWSNDTKMQSEIVKTPKLILAKPQTYMNNSGLAVAKIVDYYKIELGNVIVLHDELDLVLGKIKVRVGGAAAGHHGVESIIEKLGDDKFVRVRIGIGTKEAFLGEHKRNSFNAESFVMETFLQSEGSKVKAMIKRAVQAVEIILDQEVKIAQNQFN